MSEISNFIAARVPLIWVTTHEENRFLTEFTSSVVSSLKLSLSVWSQTSGLRSLVRTKAETFTGTEAPINAFKKISSLPEANYQQVFVMKDLFLNPLEVRYLRDMYEDLADSGKTIVIVSPFLAHNPGGSREGIPATLEKQVCVVEYSLPSFEDIVQRIKKFISSVNSKRKYSEKEIEELARALSGLTSLEIDNAISTCLAELKHLDSEYLLSFKKQSIRKSQVLEFMETDVDIDSVGGLDRVKEYFGRYKDCFDSSAIEFGVEPLKLVLMTGPPGVGKSLTCKTIGHLFKLPLLKLDMGRIFGSLVGASESRMRETLKQIEGLSPAIVMIDEIEKGLSGTRSSNQSDGGTTSRVFGTLLTAIQDGLKNVLIVGTANDVTSIPPEFIRRANEVFFVDLPGPEERWDILRIHLEKRKRKFSRFNDMRDKFLLASQGFTGAEIEKAVKDAIARAFYEKSDDVTSQHILAALSETKPISQVMESQIKELQEWARNHARYASSYSEQQNRTVSIEPTDSKRMKKLRSLN